ncbi:MAG TPA: ComF family protein [Kofleriaceae bacterium]|nr:ComF family protein [Kofleriaceae bacterium]
MAFLGRVLDLIYVPACAACDARMAGTEDAFCPACAASLYPVGCACPGCAVPIEGPRDLLCARCRRWPPPFSSARAAFRYGGQLAFALRRLKLGDRPDLARQLAPLWRPALITAAVAADLAVPVPQHWRRRAARGFDPVALLLSRAARTTGIRVDLTALRRVRKTHVQAGLSSRARAANLRGAIRAHRRVTGRRVLVVDDIMTTGATFSACAQALCEAGAQEVTCLAIARAER